MTSVVLVTDLDNTIVDSRKLDALRTARRWKECVRQLAAAPAFHDIAAIFESLRRDNVAIAIVTNSVSFYAEAMLRHHHIEYDMLIAWHDTKNHKPHPQPILVALERLSVTPGTKLYGLGDAAEDWQAYKAAKLTTLGAGWSPSIEMTAKWDKVLSDPGKLIDTLASG